MLRQISNPRDVSDNNYYGLVVVDDYSRFTSTLVIVTKDDVLIAFKQFTNFCKRKITIIFQQSNLITGESFKMIGSRDFVTNMV